MEIHAPASGSARDYFQLLKPRVMLLVVFTGLCGLLLAPAYIHPFLAVISVICIALSAGGAGAINMWLERDKDALMNRTRTRPLPSGRVNADDALALGVFCVVASTGLMAIAVNIISAALLLIAALFYVFVYTIWLKPRTAQNIVIGGAAGAFPPMIGWAAVTGDVTLAPLVLFLIIFFWTPPHFWALSLYAREDYARAGFPMLPVVAGEENTKIQMLVYAILLCPLTLLPTLLGVAGIIYFWAAVVLNALFIISALRVLHDKNNDQSYKTARQMFGYSIFYLFMIFLIMVLDKA